jgi:hypothetical protein
LNLKQLHQIERKLINVYKDLNSLNSIVSVLIVPNILHPIEKNLKRKTKNLIESLKIALVDLASLGVLVPQNAREKNRGVEKIILELPFSGVSKLKINFVITLLIIFKESKEEMKFDQLLDNLMER